MSRSGGVGANRSDGGVWRPQLVITHSQRRPHTPRPDHNRMHPQLWVDGVAGKRNRGEPSKGGRRPTVAVDPLFQSLDELLVQCAPRRFVQLRPYQPCQQLRRLPHLRHLVVLPTVTTEPNETQAGAWQEVAPSSVRAGVVCLTRWPLPRRLLPASVFSAFVASLRAVVSTNGSTVKGC